MAILDIDVIFWFVAIINRLSLIIIVDFRKTGV